MADFLDVTVGNDRRRRLLQKLLAQLQAGGQGQGAGAVGAPGSRPRSAGAALFGLSHRAPRTNVTSQSHVAGDIRSALGPGGFGLPRASEVSAGAGLPVSAPSILPQSPRSGAANAALPVTPGTPPVPPGPIHDTVQPPNPAVDVALQGPVNAPAGTSAQNLIPLGNGMFWDKVQQKLFGLPLGNVGSAAGGLIRAQ